MYKILIADDEMIERMVLRKKLIDNFKDRCEIRVAENGREVVDKFRQFVQRRGPQGLSEGREPLPVA